MRDHHWDEDGTLDMDGVGRKENELLDSDPICTVYEMFGCKREFCDAEYYDKYVFQVSDFTDDMVVAFKNHVEYPEYWYEEVEIVDYTKYGPLVGMELGGGEVGTTANVVIEGDDGGYCSGEVDMATSLGI